MTVKQAIEASLTEEDRQELKRICSPVAVAGAPESAFDAVSVLGSGEIRCYGSRMVDPEDYQSPREKIYIASRDGGLSWKTHRTPEGILGRSVQSPYSHRRVAYIGDEDGAGEFRYADTDTDDATDFVALHQPFYMIGKPPIALRTKKRWIAFGNRNGHAGTAVSDDDGETWRYVDVPEAEHFVLEPPHLSMRWENSGVEPTIAELSDGTLYMLLRTSRDVHYQSFSYDHGDSWSVPVPSPFHGTLTNPELLRLEDGRLLFFFCNNRPLPEIDKTKVWPPLWNDEINGRWEDVFTNRDVNCVAISEDEGKTWFGFRELYLNPLRNNADFRSVGSSNCGQDKSVHQFQALELPYNKVLVHVGQHERITKLMIFDVDWLYESHRREDFHFGLERVTTHVYLKSVTGNRRTGTEGHCQWNRTSGAILVPDPSGDHSEALLLRNPEDDRLFNTYQGVVWNYPAMHKGRVETRLMVQGKGVRLAILDHWMNPCDWTVPMFAGAEFTVDAAAATPGEWHDVTVSVDTDASAATLLIDGTAVQTKAFHNPAPNGVCYLHIQTAEETGDPRGTLIKYMEANREENNR